jgi:hypothetical protein
VVTERKQSGNNCYPFRTDKNGDADQFCTLGGLSFWKREAAKACEVTHPPVTPPGSKPLGPTPKPHAFHGNVDIKAAAAKMRIVEVAEEIIAVLAADTNAKVKVAVEIQVTFSSGVTDQTKRAVTENARTLNFKNADWE